MTEQGGSGQVSPEVGPAAYGRRSVCWVVVVDMKGTRWEYDQKARTGLGYIVYIIGS